MTSTACSNERVTVKAELICTGPRSILVVVQGQDKGTWLPYSRISYAEDARMGDVVDVTMPRWLAVQRGLA